MNRIDTDTAHRIWNEWIEKNARKAELLNPCDLIRAAEDAFWAINQPCPQYTVPSKHEWDKLTDDELEKIRQPKELAVVDKLKEKNHLHHTFLDDDFYVVATGAGHGVFLDDDFYVAAGTDHDKLWLGNVGGEGGDFDRAEIREMLVKFYEENF